MKGTPDRWKHAANLFHRQTELQDVSVSSEDFVRSVNLRKMNLVPSLVSRQTHHEHVGETASAVYFRLTFIVIIIITKNTIITVNVNCHPDCYFHILSECLPACGRLHFFVRYLHHHHVCPGDCWNKVLSCHITAQGSSARGCPDLHHQQHDSCPIIIKK